MADVISVADVNLASHNVLNLLRMLGDKVEIMGLGAELVTAKNHMEFSKALLSGGIVKSRASSATQTLFPVLMKNATPLIARDITAFGDFDGGFGASSANRNNTFTGMNTAYENDAYLQNLCILGEDTGIWNAYTTYAYKVIKVIMGRILDRLESYLMALVMEAGFPYIATPNIYNPTPAGGTLGFSQMNAAQLTQAWVSVSLPEYGRSNSTPAGTAYRSNSGTYGIGDFPCGFIHSYDMPTDSLFSDINYKKDIVSQCLDGVSSSRDDWIAFVPRALKYKFDANRDMPALISAPLENKLKMDIFYTDALLYNSSMLPTYYGNDDVVCVIGSTGIASYSKRSVYTVDALSSERVRWTSGVIFTAVDVGYGNGRANTLPALRSTQNLVLYCEIKTPISSRPTGGNILISRHIPLILQIPEALFYQGGDNIQLSSISGTRRPLSPFSNEDMVYIQARPVMDYFIDSSCPLTTLIPLEFSPSSVRLFPQPIINSNGDVTYSQTGYDIKTRYPLSSAESEKPFSGSTLLMQPNVPQNFSTINDITANWVTLPPGYNGGYWSDLPQINISSPFFAPHFYQTCTNGGAPLSNTRYGEIYPIVCMAKKAFKGIIYDNGLGASETNLQETIDKMRFVDIDGEKKLPFNIGKLDEMLTAYIKTHCGVLPTHGFIVPVFKESKDSRAQSLRTSAPEEVDKSESRAKKQSKASATATHMS